MRDTPKTTAPPITLPASSIEAFPDATMTIARKITNTEANIPIKKTNLTTKRKNLDVVVTTKRYIARISSMQHSPLPQQPYYYTSKESPNQVIGYFI